MFRAIIKSAFIITLLHSYCEAKEVPQNDISKIIVYKNIRKMDLLDSSGNILKSYKIAIGSNPIGKKTKKGDKKTPEGLYKIDGRNSKSRFYKSLHVSYPNDSDKIAAQNQKVEPGNNIMIHGLPNGLGWIGSIHLLWDSWTSGCIAVTDNEMDEIWNVVKDDTPIEINP